MYYGARYYSPGLMSFISADTIVPDPSHSGDLNRYGYVRNSPIQYDDPTGHCGVSCGPFMLDGGGANEDLVRCATAECTRIPAPIYVEPAENYDPSWLFPWVGAGLVAIGSAGAGFVVAVAPEILDLLDELVSGDYDEAANTSVDIGLRGGAASLFHRLWEHCTGVGCKPGGVPLHVWVEEHVHDVVFDYRPEDTVGGSYLAPGSTPPVGENSRWGPGIGGGAIVLNR